MNKLLAQTLFVHGFSLACVIAAAPSSGAHPPHPLELVMVPVACVIALERVWGQVAYLQPGELLDEV